MMDSIQSVSRTRPLVRAKGLSVPGATLVMVPGKVTRTVSTTDHLRYDRKAYSNKNAPLLRAPQKAGDLN